MADGRDRFSRIEEMPDHGDDGGIEPQIFRRPAAGDDKGIVGIGFGVGESGIQREIMATFFRIGLISLEIVDRRRDLFARRLAGAYGVNGVTKGEQRLERHHCLVVLGEIAADHQNFLAAHLILHRVAWAKTMPWPLCGRVLAGYYIGRTRIGRRKPMISASRAAAKMGYDRDRPALASVIDMNWEIIMKRFVLLLLACCAVSTAEAADPAAPVNEIMQEAVKGWAEQAQPGED